MLIITGDIPTLEATTDKKTAIRAQVQYINNQNPSYSFTATNMKITPQGTSSMSYPKKNYKLYTTEDYTKIYDSAGKEIKDKLYAFKPGAIPVDTWCLKADYAESSSTHNTGIARLWNDVMKTAKINGEYVFRTEAQKAAIEAGCQRIVALYHKALHKYYKNYPQISIVTTSFIDLLYQFESKDIF